MNALDSESDPRLYQNLEYLEILIIEWTKGFRKSADTLTPLYANTTANNTPNTTLNSAGLDNIESSSAVDYAISLPFASHEIFIKLTGMMKYIDLVPLILRILYGCLPFLKLHVECINNKLSRESDGLLPSLPENIVLYYFCHISDALDCFERMDNNDLYLLQIREELIYFALRTYTALSSTIDVNYSNTDDRNQTNQY